MDGQGVASADSDAGLHAFYLPRGAPAKPCITRAQGVFLWDREGAAIST